MDCRTLVACDSAWEAYHQPRVGESQSSDQMIPDDQMHILRMFVIYLFFGINIPTMLPRESENYWLSSDQSQSECAFHKLQQSLVDIFLKFAMYHCYPLLTVSIQIPILSFFQQMLHLNLFSQTLYSGSETVQTCPCAKTCASKRFRPS